jgi:hypothetical protein
VFKGSSSISTRIETVKGETEMSSLTKLILNECEVEDYGDEGLQTQLLREEKISIVDILKRKKKGKAPKENVNMHRLSESENPYGLHSHLPSQRKKRETRR